MTDLVDINSFLGLRTLPLSNQEYSELVYRKFNSPSTLVFLDTNVLALPFRFHKLARDGFFHLFNSAVNERRLLVPAWASNEFFFNAFKADVNVHKLGQNIKQSLGGYPSREVLLDVLSRAASDASRDALALQFGVDKSQVLDHVAKFFVDGAKAVEHVGKELDPDVIHEEIEAAFKGCFLSLDFQKHCALLDCHADRRRSNRIAPGLTDAAKGDIERRGNSAGNIDGDLALWLEVLQVAANPSQAVGAVSVLRQSTTSSVSGADAPASSQVIETGAINSSVAQPEPRIFDTVLVICQEVKPDFLYAPKYRFRPVEQRARTSTNVKNVEPKISLIDPRLTSEFEARIGHRSVAFVNMEHLAFGWSQSTSVTAASANAIRQFAMGLSKQIDAASPQPSQSTPRHQDAINVDSNETTESDSRLASQASTAREVVTGETSSRLSNRTLDHETEDSGTVDRDNGLSVEAGSMGPETEAQTTEAENSAYSDLLPVPDGALNDEKAFVEGIREPALKSVLDDLYTHNWYVQNPAVVTLEAMSIPSDLGMSFVLGRAVYQAADGSAWRAAKFIENFDAWATTGTSSHQAFLAGAGYEAFFNGRGEFRDSPKSGSLTEVGSLIRRPLWVPAKRFLFSRLNSEMPLYRPFADAISTVHLTLRLRQVNLAEQNFWMVDDVCLKLAGGADVSVLDSSTPSGFEVRFSPNEFSETVAKFLMIPTDSLEMTSSSGVFDVSKLICDSNSSFSTLALRRQA